MTSGNESPSDLIQYAASILDAGSTSFAAAARLFDPATRQSAALLYAWCRHCDDVVDGQTLGHGGQLASEGAQSRLSRLEQATGAALAGKPPPDPAFRALAVVAARHALPPSLFLAHLDGFRRDVEGQTYDSLDDLLRYCWGVAGVVGEMMARIVGVRDRDTLDRAVDLGLAFQLTNIARDVIEDARLGRIYLPLAWLRDAGIPPNPSGLMHPAHRRVLTANIGRLIAAAEPFYDSALCGIGRLPLRSATAVGAAREVYRAIGRKVVRHGEAGLGIRVATTRTEKILLVSTGVAAALAARTMAARPRDPDLWHRSTAVE